MFTLGNNMVRAAVKVRAVLVRLFGVNFQYLAGYAAAFIGALLMGALSR